MIAGSDAETGYKVPEHRKECGLPLKLGGECTVQRDERGDADEHTVEVVELFPPAQDMRSASRAKVKIALGHGRFLGNGMKMNKRGC